MTMIFSSDDFHIYRSMKKNATRMHVLSIRDLTPAETHVFLSGTHKTNHPDAPPVTRQQSMRIWDMIGGRLSFLSRLAKFEDMDTAAEDMIDGEMHWLHHRLGLIPDHDDDVMDEQKVSSCSFVSQHLSGRLSTRLRSCPQLLFQAFAKLAEEAEATRQKTEQEIATSSASETSGVDLEEQLERDLVNVLSDEMDPKVSYREAVSSNRQPFE